MAGFEGFSEDLRSAPSSFRSDDPATSVLYGRAFSADLAVALTPEEARLVHDAEIQSLEGTLEMALADFSATPKACLVVRRHREKVRRRMNKAPRRSAGRRRREGEATTPGCRRQHARAGRRAVVSRIG